MSFKASGERRSWGFKFNPILKHIFLGFRNGLNPRSLSSKVSNTRNLPKNHKYMASEPSGIDRKYLHGGGSRYIQENNDEYYTEG